MGDLEDTPSGPGPIVFVQTGASDDGDAQPAGDAAALSQNLMEGLADTIDRRGSESGDERPFDADALRAINSEWIVLQNDDDFEDDQDALLDFILTTVNSHNLRARTWGETAAGVDPASFSAGDGPDAGGTIDGLDSHPSQG